MQSNWHIEYYTNDRGVSPIKAFIDKMPLRDRARTFKTFELLELYGPLIGMPYVRQVAKQLSELRIKTEGGLYRFLFITKFKKTIVILHAFKKKSAKTPLKEIEVALARRKGLG